MNDTPALGLGGFLLGLGIGWLVFKEFFITSSNFAWLLILIGVVVVISAIIGRFSPSFNIGRLIGGAAGGLVLALILTQGIGFINLIPGADGGRLPYSSTESKQYSGASSFSNVYLILESINGPVTISTWDKTEYRIEAIITARGASQQEADENLAKLGKEIVKEENGETLKLTLIYRSQIIINSPYQISVDVKLPANAMKQLEITTSNAAINLSNIKGNSITLQTSNGQINLTNIEADLIKASTSNAQIRGNVEAITFTASTSNARVELSLPSQYSGTYDISTSNAAVIITVGQSAAYRLKGSTTNAEVSFNLPDLVYSTNTKTRKEAQSSNYDQLSTKIIIDIQTSNANIDVRRNISSI